MDKTTLTKWIYKQTHTMYKELKHNPVPALECKLTAKYLRLGRLMRLTPNATTDNTTTTKTLLTTETAQTWYTFIYDL